MSTRPDADPTPWLRCRCVAALWDIRPDPYLHRCTERPVGEHGLCGHCAQPLGDCTDPLCLTPRACCLAAHTHRRILVPLTTPCAAVRAPF